MESGLSYIDRGLLYSLLISQQAMQTNGLMSLKNARLRTITKRPLKVFQLGRTFDVQVLDFCAAVMLIQRLQISQTQGDALEAFSLLLPLLQFLSSFNILSLDKMFQDWQKPTQICFGNFIRSQLFYATCAAFESCLHSLSLEKIVILVCLLQNIHNLGL